MKHHWLEKEGYYRDKSFFFTKFQFDGDYHELVSGDNDLQH